MEKLTKIQEIDEIIQMKYECVSIIYVYSIKNLANMLKIVQKSKEKAYSDKNLGKNTQEKSNKSLLFILIFIDQCKMKKILEI